LAKVTSETAEKVIAHTGRGSFFDRDNAVVLVIKRRDDSPQAKRDDACGDQQWGRIVWEVAPAGFAYGNKILPPLPITRTPAPRRGFCYWFRVAA
jgi:hypothetical protein